MSARVRTNRAPKEPVAPEIPAALSEAELPGNDLVDDAIFMSMAFNGIDLSHRTAESAEFVRCRLVDCSLAVGSLERCGFTDVEINRCDLSGTAARGTTVFNTAIAASRLTGMRWTECGFRNLLVEGCRADLAAFRFCTFKDTVFRDCVLTEANFAEADLRGARFEGCRLAGAQFSNAKMTGTRFTDCDLMGIGGVASLRGSIIKTGDAQGLVYALATAMGITIDDG